jgi:hypothetical protein
MPDQPRPLGDCQPIPYQPNQWECFFGRDRNVQVDGMDGKIYGTTFVFTGVRLGDVYSVLGKPLRVDETGHGVWKIIWRNAMLYSTSPDPSRPVYNLTFWSVK